MAIWPGARFEMTFGNEEGGNPARALLHIHFVVVLDGGDAAEPHPHDGPGPKRLLAGHREPAVLHRQLGRGQGVLHEQVHLLDFPGVDEVLRVEIVHLAADAAGEGFDVVETR